MTHFLGIFSFLGAVIGSYLIASNTSMNGWGYVAFLISSLAAIVLLLRMKDRQWYLIVQNIYFIGINVLGLVNYGI